MKEKVVVTGGAGFIGSNIVDACVDKGFDVHVIDNLCVGKKENVHSNASLHICDIRNLKDIDPIINGAKYVFHTAALPRVQYSIKHPDITNDVNVNGTLNVLIASSNSGVKKVVYSASGSAYGDQEKIPLVETMDAQPKSPYGLQKYIGEIYCKLWSEVYNLPTVSLRYFNVYGNRQDPEGDYALVIGKFLKQRKEDKSLTITGDGEQTRDFTNVDDVVNANILAAENKDISKGEVINIGAGDNISINKLAKLIGGEIKYIKERLEPKHSKADNTKAKKLLNWEPKISIENGIDELKN